MKEYPSKSLIKSLFEYKNGGLYWIKKQNKRIVIGSKAGYVNVHGRRVVSINNKKYYTNKLTYIYHFGHCPIIVDHVDRNPLNDNIENLRASDYSKNQMNRSKIKKCASKFKGVTVRVNKSGQPIYYANIKLNGINNRLGSFDNEAHAAEKYNQKAIELFGEFASLNTF